MKKAIIILMVMMLIFTACSSNEEGQNATEQLATQESAQQDLQGDNESAQTEEAVQVDIDLTAMTSTMVYAQVYDMITKPDDYVDKTIRVKGIYNTEYFEPTDTTYHLLIIVDATGCCPQGLEFIYTGEEDYPNVPAVVEMVGSIGVHVENGYTYLQIFTDDITVLAEY